LFYHLLTEIEELEERAFGIEEQQGQRKRHPHGLFFSQASLVEIAHFVLHVHQQGLCDQIDQIVERIERSRRTLTLIERLLRPREVEMRSRETGSTPMMRN
jgi:hypothetical protein